MSITALRLPSVADLQAARNRFVAQTNADPSLLVDGHPDKIVAAVKIGH